MTEVFPFADGTTTTLEELRTRVTVDEPGIVRLMEPPHGTIETLTALGDIADELGSQFDKYVLLLDLAEGVQGPSAEYREGIVAWMRSLKCVHTSFVQPGNIVARVALRFMIGRAGTSTSVHKTRNKALENARTFL